MRSGFFKSQKDEGGTTSSLTDTGERMIPTENGEVSFVFARHQFAYQYAQKFVELKTAIDVGCGTGYGCKILAEKAKYVVGIDYDFDALAYCRNNHGSANIRYAQMDAMHVGSREAFDIAVSFQTIEHMTKPGEFIEQLRSVVKPGGEILISTPNVPIPKQTSGNPFHQMEFDFGQFRRLLGSSFSHFCICGIVYAASNPVRSIIQSLPFYGWGRRLTRTSKIKKLANRALDLTSFRIVDTEVEKSMDLIAICKNEQSWD